MKLSWRELSIPSNRMILLCFRFCAEAALARIIPYWSDTLFTECASVRVLRCMSDIARNSTSSFSVHFLSQRESEREIWSFRRKKEWREMWQKSEIWQFYNHQRASEPLDEVSGTSVYLQWQEYLDTEAMLEIYEFLCIRLGFLINGGLWGNCRRLWVGGKLITLFIPLDNFKHFFGQKLTDFHQYSLKIKDWGFEMFVWVCICSRVFIWDEMSYRC